ncbi:MAG: GGDEF domain-containing protein [Planctomycetota bacterium]|jgi:GGDEF domain-containing protein
MMSGVDKESSRDGGSRKILLLGDAHKAFLDADALEEKCFEACATIAEATDAARRNRFAAVAVVISGLPIGLKSALEALRDCCEARIVLLAQMYEEPIAIRLVNCAHNGASLANDYLICPVEPERFYESITAAPEPGPVEPPLPAAVRTSAETRIRDLERLATEDDLTGLKNRRYIREFARQIIERAAQENGRVTLLVFDIDDFKHYNDVYGHCTGDEILRQAAALMRRCCRGHDVVGRIGGDEFAVVFWDDPQRASNSKIDIRKSTMPAGRGRDRRSASADHPKEALFIARRFVGELEKAGLSSFGVLGPGGKGVLTISGGLASFPRDGRTSDELFLLADKALLEAKRSGKNRIYLVGKPQNNIADIK